MGSLRTSKRDLNLESEFALWKFGMNGLNLLQQVRRMPHRLHTPIVILLSDPIGDEGLRAGANAVLLKPEDISAIARNNHAVVKDCV